MPTVEGLLFIELLALVVQESFLLIVQLFLLGVFAQHLLEVFVKLALLGLTVGYGRSLGRRTSRFDLILTCRVYDCCQRPFSADRVIDHTFYYGLLLHFDACRLATHLL